MAVKKKFPYRSAFVACNGGCHVTVSTGSMMFQVYSPVVSYI